MLQDILGQEFAVSLLRNSLESGKISHAYLFFGPEGVGKGKAAIEFAKALNCQTSIEGCDTCIPCRKVEKKIHPDIFYIIPEGDSIRLQQIKDIQKTASYKPFEGKKKVIIIEDAGKMLPEATNAFLKTLEEPPNDTVIILTCVNPKELLPTIFSRCCPVRFNLLKNDDLKKIILANRGSFDEVEYEKAVTFAQGTVKGVLDYDEEKITELKQQAFFIITRSSLKDVTNIVATSKAMSDNKKAYVLSVIEHIILFLRDIMIIMTCGTDVEDMLINSYMYDEICAIAPMFSPDTIYKIFNHVLYVREGIKGNANLQLSVEVLMISIARLRHPNNINIPQ